MEMYIGGKLVQFKLIWAVLEVGETADDEGGSSTSLASFACGRFQDGTDINRLGRDSCSDIASR